MTETRIASAELLFKLGAWPFFLFGGLHFLGTLVDVNLWFYLPAAGSGFALPCFTLSFVLTRAPAARLEQGVTR